MLPKKGNIQTEGSVSTDGHTTTITTGLLLFFISHFFVFNNRKSYSQTTSNHIYYFKKSSLRNLVKLLVAVTFDPFLTKFSSVKPDSLFLICSLLLVLKSTSHRLPVWLQPQTRTVYRSQPTEKHLLPLSCKVCLPLFVCVWGGVRGGALTRLHSSDS